MGKPELFRSRRLPLRYNSRKPKQRSGDGPMFCAQKSCSNGMCCGPDANRSNAWSHHAIPSLVGSSPAKTSIRLNFKNFLTHEQQIHALISSTFALTMLIRKSARACCRHQRYLSTTAPASFISPYQRTPPISQPKADIAKRGQSTATQNAP